MSNPPARQPASCLGCLGFLTIGLGDLAVMVIAAINGKIWVLFAAWVLLMLILPAARWYRGVTPP